MNLFAYLTSALLGLTFAAIVGLVTGTAFGQTPQPTPPAMTCEQQLDQATRTILQLRKANAQADYQNAALQETLLEMQKKPPVAATPVPPKAAK